MIHFNPEQRLNIVLPNTNKALAEAIRQATPEQLELLKESKDVKGLLTALSEKTLDQSGSNKALLDILKHSPAFKDLGSFQSDLKTLITSLKSDPQFQALAAKLETLQIQTPLPTSTGELQRRIADSGVFLESKLAQAAKPAEALKPLLQDLALLLQRSELPVGQRAQQQFNALLSHDLLRTTAPYDDTQAQRLATVIEKVLAPLNTLLAQSDALHTPDTRSLLERLSQLVTALKSNTPAHATALPPQQLQNLQENLEALHVKLLQSTLGESRSLVQRVEAIVTLLKSSPAPEALENALQQLVTQAKNLSNDTDVLLSKEVRPLLQELARLSTPERLSATLPLDTIAKDTKALLLQTQQELQQAPVTPTTSDALKQVDRLMLQIDYHQLYSHLSGNATLYMPYSWDLLQEGSIAFSRDKENCFYCRIDLTLQHFGSIDLMLSLNKDKRIDIRGVTENPELSEIIKSQLPLLRDALRDAGLIAGQIRVAPNSESSSGYEADDIGFDVGFEVKI